MTKSDASLNTCFAFCENCRPKMGDSRLIDDLFIKAS